MARVRRLHFNKHTIILICHILLNVKIDQFNSKNLKVRTFPQYHLHFLIYYTHIYNFIEKRILSYFIKMDTKKPKEFHRYFSNSKIIIKVSQMMQ